VVVVPVDPRPDVVNGTDAGLWTMDDVPVEAIIGLSVALVLLAIIVSVTLLVAFCVDNREGQF